MSMYQFPPASTIAPAIGGATSANQTLEIADLDAIKISTASMDTKLTSQATSANQALQITQETAINTNIGTDITTPTAMPAGGAGVRGWLSAIWTKLNGSLAVTGTFFQATQPVSATTLPLPTGASTETTLGLVAKDATLVAEGVLIGAVTETAPVSDTASSGLNGRLQRIAQRISSLIALLPTALGQGTMATSLKVVLPSDQSAVPISGTVTQIETPKTTSYIQSLTLDGTTAQTFAPPVGAKNLKIHAGANNTVNLSIAFGGIAATATVGELFEPSRSEDYVGVSNVSIICESVITNHKVSLIWSV